MGTGSNKMTHGFQFVGENVRFRGNTAAAKDKIVFPLGPLHNVNLRLVFISLQQNRNGSTCRLTANADEDRNGCSALMVVQNSKLYFMTS